MTQYGVTFNFDREVTACQFFNGDYAIQGLVTITSITPSISQTPVAISSTQTVTAIRNGYDVNPYNAIDVLSEFRQLNWKLR